MNRRQFLGALGTSATVLSGCTARSIGNEPDESPTPTDTQPTSADTQRKLNSVQLTITGDSVAPGETAKLAITGYSIESLTFDGDTPEDWGDMGTVLGDPSFEPTFDGAAKSLPPEYFWNPYAEHVEGMYPIHVPESAAEGDYTVPFLANCHYEDYCDGSTRAEATVTVK